MSTRLEYEIRRALRGLLSRAGSPPVSAGLLALAAIYLAVAGLWARAGGREAAGALVGSVPFGALAIALLFDSVASALRAVPVRVGEAGGPVLAPPGMKDWGRLLLRGAYVLGAAAFAASMLARDVLTIRVAEGEEVTSVGEQIVGRDPPRPYARGPYPVALLVEEVDGLLRPDGGTDGLSVRIRGADGGRRTLGPWRPLWAGWGRYLVPMRAGYTIRYSVAFDRGAGLDSAFAKLDLLPAGKYEEVRSEVIPHRLVFSIRPEARWNLSLPALEVTVFRSRLLVGGGRLDPATAVRFDGLVLTVPELRRWVEFKMVRDPGVGIAILAALVGLAGLLVMGAARLRASGG